MNYYTYTGVVNRATASKNRYGPFSSTHEALGVACEEWDELRAAIHANDMLAIRSECLNLAAVLIRLADQLEAPNNTALVQRSVK